MSSDKVPDIQGASYTYDSRNRLTQVTTEKGKTVSYRYNGDGLMVERSENGVTTRYYYDDRALIVAEGTVNPDATVAIAAAYVHDASGKLLARQVPGQSGLQYYFTNGHGDVTEIRDAQGNLLNRYTYDIWGNPLTEEEQVPNMFRYSGEYWDKTTNLQYLRARWYDPSIGRFITEDSFEGELTNPLSLNPYTYVENNPLIYTDPTGEIANCIMRCFSAGTKVQTDEGYKAIETIEVGDKVLAKNEETGELAYKEVEETFQRVAEETYHVTVAGTTMITTAEHPFWVPGTGWVEAKDLKVGDRLVDNEGKEYPIESIEIEKEKRTVYNFRVNGPLIKNTLVTFLEKLRGICMIPLAIEVCFKAPLRIVATIWEPISMETNGMLKFKKMVHKFGCRLEMVK
ncbi:polymorphic toxin-type HINT domain-containing protein [Paenibacillus apiarius]|nr:polymorphic toxin-type HINT domain-containing protein [Paenibacillus apiarius]